MSYTAPRGMDPEEMFEAMLERICNEREAKMELMFRFKAVSQELREANERIEELRLSLEAK